MTEVELSGVCETMGIHICKGEALPKQWTVLFVKSSVSPEHQVCDQVVSGLFSKESPRVNEPYRPLRDHALRIVPVAGNHIIPQ